MFMKNTKHVGATTYESVGVQAHCMEYLAWATVIWYVASAMQPFAVHTATTCYCVHYYVAKCCRWCQRHSRRRHSWPGFTSLRCHELRFSSLEPAVDHRCWCYAHSHSSSSSSSQCKIHHCLQSYLSWWQLATRSSLPRQSKFCCILDKLSSNTFTAGGEAYALTHHYFSIW